MPVIDRRDRYREQVDKAVDDFGDSRPTPWSSVPRVKAKRILYRTIFTESDWLNLANNSVPESLKYPNDGVGKDLNSVGLLQQRSQYWGTTQGSMDPWVAATRFLEQMLVKAPAWMSLEDWDVAQRVQQSQYDGVKIDSRTGKPYPYAQNYKDREVQTLAMEKNPRYYTDGGV